MASVNFGFKRFGVFIGFCCTFSRHGFRISLSNFTLAGLLFLTVIGCRGDFKNCVRKFLINSIQTKAKAF